MKLSNIIKNASLFVYSLLISCSMFANCSVSKFRQPFSDILSNAFSGNARPSNAPAAQRRTSRDGHTTTHSTAVADAVDDADACAHRIWAALNMRTRTVVCMRVFLHKEMCVYVRTFACVIAQNKSICFSPSPPPVASAAAAAADAAPLNNRQRQYRLSARRHSAVFRCNTLSDTLAHSHNKTRSRRFAVDAKFINKMPCMHDRSLVCMFVCLCVHMRMAGGKDLTQLLV